MAKMSTATGNLGDYEAGLGDFRIKFWGMKLSELLAKDYTVKSVFCAGRIGRQDDGEEHSLF